MPSINIEKILPQMLEAASKILKDKWPDAKDYSQVEFKKIGISIAFIGEQVAAGTMNEKQARLHLKLQKLAAQNVLLTLEGLGLLAVEAAINAALKVIKDSVNTAIGFVLI